MDKAVKWDSEAQNYQRTYLLGENQYNGELMDFLAAECGLRPGCRVIDIGCGVGKYGVYFANMGCHVTLTDISPKMLEYAQKNMAMTGSKWQTICCDWHAAPLDTAAFKEKFQLAISTMSPAICDVETVEKMSAVTEGFCFVSMFCRWDDPLRSSFCKRLGLEDRPVFENMDERCAQLIQCVCEAGFVPQISYRDYCWADERTAAEAAERFIARYYKAEEAPEHIKQAALEFARELAEEDGTITESINTKVLWLYWSTTEKGGAQA